MTQEPSKITKVLGTVIAGVGAITTIAAAILQPEEARSFIILDARGCPFLRTFASSESEVGLKLPTKLMSLKNLLADKNWVEADLATDLLRPESLSCSELLSINELWLNYSNNYFGYSVQRKIWEQRKLNGKYADFAEFVDWKRDDRYAFNIHDPILITDPNAPTKALLGHLPFNGWQVKGIIREGFDAFMLKLAQCKI